jgi:hypothetical protein
MVQKSHIKKYKDGVLIDTIYPDLTTPNVQVEEVEEIAVKSKSRRKPSKKKAKQAKKETTEG